VTSIAATTTYADSGLTSGTTYYYVVTAVDSNGVESPYSNQASAKSK
jgi:fibronectin type 3 domain-containing protein